MKKVAIILAGGTGTRMGQDIPKQFLNVEDKPIIIYTLEAFQKHPDIDGIITVCLDGWHEILNAYAKQFNITKLKSIVSGGDSNQESIFNGLQEAKKIYDMNDIVLIHDGNRPLVTEEIISNSIAVCQTYGNAVAVVPCTTVVLRKNDDKSSEEVVERDELYLTQTPHTYKLQDILSAHEEAKKKGITNMAASCSLYISIGRKVFYSVGDETNIKLTRTGDIQIFKALHNTKKEDWIK